MTDDYRTILERLNQQDKAALERIDEQHKTFLIIRNDISNLQNVLEPIVEQHNEIYEVFTVITKGTSWASTALKYALYVVGAIIGIYLSVREIFKH